MSRFEFSLVITHQQFLGNYCIQFLDIMMKGFLLWTVIFAIIALSYAELNLHPLSDEFINSINNKNTTWKAGRNFDISFPLTQLKKLSGVLPKGDHVSELPLKIHSEKAEEIPESFDAREAWPQCTSIIGDIQDQGSCGSCWAFGAVETMSDRICIHSNGTIKVTLSAEDLLDCCECGGGCEGGYNDLAWQYYGNRGIVTGGKYGSTDGCKAYSIKPCDHRVDGLLGPCEEEPNPTPACKKECDSDSLDYKSDLRKGTSYTIDASVTQIQTEIMTNGPVEADYDVYEDFFSYKSGVYRHVAGEYNSKHAIKIIGWGVEDGTPYWLIVNSWNENWGEKGYFKMLRGEDECGIESDIFAGMPIF